MENLVFTMVLIFFACMGVFPCPDCHVEDAMHKPPDYELPAGAVPDAAYKEYDQAVDVGSVFSFSVPSKGNIQVSGEKPGQCDMPALPKFHDIGSFVGGIEVEGQLDAKHAGNTHRHIAVPAEIKIKLKCVGKHDDDCVGRI